MTEVIGLASAKDGDLMQDPALALKLVGGDGSRCVEVFARAVTQAERLLSWMGSSHHTGT